MMMLLALALVQTPDSVRLSYHPVPGAGRRYVYVESSTGAVRSAVASNTVYFFAAAVSDSGGSTAVRIAVDSAVQMMSHGTEPATDLGDGATLHYDRRRSLASADSASLAAVVPFSFPGLVANASVPLPDAMVRRGSPWRGEMLLRLMTLGEGTGELHARLSCKVSAIRIDGADTVVDIDVTVDANSEKREMRGSINQVQWVNGKLKGREAYSISQSATLSLQLTGTLSKSFDLGSGRTVALPYAVRLTLDPAIAR